MKIIGRGKEREWNGSGTMPDLNKIFQKFSDLHLNLIFLPYLATIISKSLSKFW